MIKIICSIIIFFIFSTAASPILAENTNSSSAAENKNEILIQKQLEYKSKMITGIQNEKNIMKNKIKDLQTQIKEKRAELKPTLIEKREEYKNKIQKIKDEKKKNIINKTDERLAVINKNQTDRMAERLERLNEMLNKIIAKKDELKTAGVDVTALETALSEAQTAIETAKKAIADQTAKEYIAEITDEANLGNTVSTVVAQVKNDLKATHQSLVNARQAIKKAASELAKIKHNNPISPVISATPVTITPETTPVAQITST